MAGQKQNWSFSKTHVLLDILKELKIVERLDGRKSRNQELFIQVHERLKEVGIDRSIEQIKNRWKSLKTAYYKAKNHNARSGVDPSTFPYNGAIDDFMGDRPLSNVVTNGVDVGFEEEEATCSTPASQNLTECSINDETNDGAQSSDLDTSDNRSSGEATKKRKRHGSSGYAKAMSTWMTEQQAFFERMQESQNRWVEEQQQRRLERDQRLLTQFVEDSSRANERLVTQLLDGLRSIVRPPPPPPPAHPPPVAPYSSQHSFTNYSRAANYSQNTSHYSNNSEYTLQDLS